MDPNYLALIGGLAVVACFAFVLRRRGSAASRAAGRLAKLEAASSDALLWVSRSGAVLQWNHIAEKFFSSGLLRRRVSLDALATPDSGAGLSRRLAECLCLSSVENAARRVRCSANGSDGQSFPVSVDLYPLENEPCCLVVIEDQTRHEGSVRELRDYSHQLLATKQALLAQNTQLEETVRLRTEELSRAKDEAESANQVKTEFLANMSHELRTPLHGILSFSRFGLQRTGLVDNNKISTYFNRINSNGEVLLGMVDQLLDMARLDAGSEEFRFELCSVTAVVSEVLQELDSLAEEKTLAFNWSAPAAPVIVSADREKLSCVVRNLIGNAVKHSPNGGAVDVTLTLNANPEGCHLEVSDQGPGIPEADLEAVFDRFFQTAAGTQLGAGTGLGLAIAQKIVHRHDGEIWATNNKCGGATFGVVLPANTGSAILAPPSGALQEGEI